MMGRKQKEKKQYGQLRLKFNNGGAVLVLLSFLLSFGAWAQSAAPRPDFAGLYRPAAKHLLVETRREADSLRLLLNWPGTPAGQLLPRLRLTVWPTYDAKQPLLQTTQRLHLYPGADPAGATLVLTVALPAAQLPAGSVLQVRLDQPALTNQPEGPDQDPATTAWVRLTPERLARPFVLLDSMGMILGRPYMRAGEAVVVVGFGLPQPVRTVPLLVARSDFPGQSTPDELIENLLYLTTAAERQQLRQAADPKRAVDQFWLTAAGGDQTRARDLIRRYYGLVTSANELFTGHKPGWLTDRGLLYVVLGAPASVRRLPTGEEQWQYAELDRNGRELSFTFRPRPSTLAPDNYELVRRPEYESLWYAAV